MARRGFSTIRPLTRGEFEATLRDMRQERPKIVQDREAWKKEQVEKALRNPHRTRKY